MDKELNYLTSVLSSKRFLDKKGLGNELPFFIFPYPAMDELKVKTLIYHLIEKLGDLNIRILQINLYDLSIEILKDRGILDRILEKEASLSKQKLKELLQSVLDTETHLIPAIKNKMSEKTFDILLISGIGEVVPYIRSHNVLSNLQSTAKNPPTIMFFPGKYEHSLEDGTSLQLFGRLHDDKYYRAFNIYHYEV